MEQIEVRRHVFNQQGELIASANQKCLIRLREQEHSVAVLSGDGLTRNDRS